MTIPRGAIGITLQLAQQHRVGQQADIHILDSRHQRFDQRRLAAGGRLEPPYRDAFLPPQRFDVRFAHRVGFRQDIGALPLTGQGSDPLALQAPTGFGEAVDGDHHLIRPVDDDQRGEVHIAGEVDPHHVLVAGYRNRPLWCNRGLVDSAEHRPAIFEKSSLEFLLENALRQHGPRFFDLLRFDDRVGNGRVVPGLPVFDHRVEAGLKNPVKPVPPTRGGNDQGLTLKVGKGRTQAVVPDVFVNEGGFVHDDKIDADSAQSIGVYY